MKSLWVTLSQLKELKGKQKRGTNNAERNDLEK